MNLLFVPQILTWTAILALQSANASSLRSNCSKKLSMEQLRCFLGEDASFWQDQSHHILSLLTLTKDFLLKISEMLWEQLQDKLVCIAGVLLTIFLLGYLLYRCCSHADGYRTLMNVQDDLGIDELFKVPPWNSARCHFMAIDVTLDNVNGIIYCWRGFKVFGPLTLAIPVVAGFLLLSLQAKQLGFGTMGPHRCYRKEDKLLLQKRDRNGQLKPGLKSAILQMLQVEAFLTAYAAYKDPKKHEREWKVETAFNGVVEGFPSALLQMYTLFCMEHSNSLPCPFSTYINIVSILFFVLRHWQGLERGLFELLSTDKGGATTWRIDDHSAESAAEPRRFCPNLCSGSYWHKSSTSSWYDSKQSVLLPPLMLLELLVIWTMSKWYFGCGHSLPQIPSFSLCWNICHCQCWWELVWVCKNNFAFSFARWRGEQWNLLVAQSLFGTTSTRTRKNHTSTWPVLQLPVLARSLWLSQSSS